MLPTCSCCFRPRFLMPLLHSESFRRLDWSFMTTSLMPCSSCKAGRLSEGLPGSTIALGPFLQLSVAPYRYMAVPISVLQCPNNVLWGFLVRNFLMLRHGLFFCWIFFKIHGPHLSKSILFSASLGSRPVSKLVSVFLDRPSRRRPSCPAFL